MKKTFLISALVLVTGIVNAQGNKFWIGGAAQFKNTSNDADEKVTSGIFSPGIGYCINSKIAVGIGFDITGSKDEYKESSVSYTDKTSEMGIAPFVRYYKSVGDKFSLYGELNVGFGAGKKTTEGGGNSSKDTYGFFQAGIAPGVQYWFHDNWSINAEWGALRYRADNDKADVQGQSDFKSNEFQVGLDLTALSIGLNFHF